MKLFKLLSSFSSTFLDYYDDDPDKEEVLVAPREGQLPT